VWKENGREVAQLARNLSIRGTPLAFPQKELVHAPVDSKGGREEGKKEVN